MKRVGIIGAGPAGLTAALQLAKKGVAVEVFEAAPQVGGLARTISLWGQRVDLGPHRFFSKDPRVNQVWLDVAGSDYRIVDRQTRICQDGKFYDYPLRAGNALRNMGLPAACACAASYGWQLLKNLGAPPPATFEEWTVAMFGRRLFERFFKSYSEKLWGIGCDELDADFAAQRIKKFSFAEAVLNAAGLGRQQHKTLVDQFPYPLHGTGMIYERMAERVRALGGSVRLSTPVAGVLPEGAGLRFADGSEQSFDHLISTMPLTLMAKSLPGIPAAVLAAAEQLRYRNTLLIYLRIGSSALFPDQWIYVQSPGLRLGRVTNFRNWTPELHGESPDTILALEYWCNEGDDTWTAPDESLIALAKDELRQTGLLGSAPVLDGRVVRLPRCYPVYRRGYREQLAPLIAHLRTLPRLSAIGRYGAFKYNNQDHSILMGVLAAENIADGAAHDLWSVNTDYEVFQEESTLESSGLAPVTGKV